MSSEQVLGSGFGERIEPTSFEFQRADSWDEAVELLRIWDGEAKIIAGGQSLVPMLNLRLTMPGALIDINDIGDEGGPRLEDGDDGPVVVVPALSTHTTVLGSSVIAEHCPMLQHAVGLVGNVRVRNRGTFGGSVAHADPTGEIPCCVLSMGGTVTLRGPQGTRTVPATEWFRTYLTTAAEPDELVTEVRIPSAAGQRGRSRRRYDGSPTSPRCRSPCRPGHGVVPAIVLGGVADRPVLVPEDVVDPLSNPGGRGSGGGGRVSCPFGAPRVRRTRQRGAPPSAGASPGTSCAGPCPAPPRFDRRPLMIRTQVRLQVNGVEHEVWIRNDRTLLNALHDDLGLPDVRYGCNEGVCGTCTVLVDGAPTSACLMYAVQAEGHEVTTLHGLADPTEDLHPLQKCFLERGGSQCGFCTPGIMLTAAALAGAEAGRQPRGHPLRAGRQPVSLHRLHRDRRLRRGLDERRARRARGPGERGMPQRPASRTRGGSVMSEVTRDRTPRSSSRRLQRRRHLARAPRLRRQGARNAAVRRGLEAAGHALRQGGPLRDGIGPRQEHRRERGPQSRRRHHRPDSRGRAPQRDRRARQRRPWRADSRATGARPGPGSLCRGAVGGHRSRRPGDGG